MKKTVRIAALLLAVVTVMCFAACGGSQKPDAPAVPNSPAAPSQTENSGFEPIAMSARSEGLTFTIDDGTVVIESQIDHPAVTGGGEGAAAAVQTYLEGEVSVVEGELHQEQQEFNEYGVFDPNAPAGFCELSFKTLRSDAQVFTALMSIERYTMGAAHPGVILRVFNFDPVTGERLKLSSLGINGRDPSGDIASLLAKKFIACEYRGDFGMSMEEAVESISFMLGINQDQPGDVWYISGDSLVFISNQYELASYAVGCFALTLSADELNGIVRSDLFTGGEAILPGGVSVAPPAADEPPTPDAPQPDEPADPMPGTAMSSGELCESFSYVHFAEIPSGYTEENLIWWNCDVYDIAIYELEWDENFDTVVGGNIVYQQPDCAQGEAILLRAFIPEVIPSHAIRGTINGVTYHWALCYNGRDGGISFMEIDPQPAG